MTRRTLFVMFIFSLLLAGCVDPYNPPEVQTSENFLVVDGLVDLSSDNARVVLVRSQGLDEEGEPIRESGANITIEKADGQKFVLTESVTGEYTASGLVISPGDQCQLRIRTASGGEYLSDMVASKVTPPIDSITWTAHPTQLDIEVNSHDPTGNTRYYRWKYEQTVMYQSVHASSYVWDAGLGEVRGRTLDERIFECWKTTPSTNIEVFSTNGLAEDIVSKHILRSFPSTAWELRIKYSILVHQYAIDEDEFNFWTEIKKNTENIGTIFDPQPSQVTGNIHALNSQDEKVLGYFSVSSSVEQRIFIARDELPYRFGDYQNGYPSCSYFNVDTLSVEDYFNGGKYELLINAIYDGPALVGYTTAENYCIDCRLAHDGINTKPDFWE